MSAPRRRALTVPDGKPPRIWLLLGDKVGDNRQVERIAEALGEPFEMHRLVFEPRWRQGKPPFLPALYHVDQGASDALGPPWPDLILTIGRRPAMAALWIRRRSRNRTRLVLFGRPKRYFSDFDLIVTPVQYRMPEHARVLQLGLPLIRLDEARIAAEADAWQERLAAMPRPLTVLLVGGKTKPFDMDASVARELLARTLESMPAGGGLFVSTSRRTPTVVVDTLRDRLPEGAKLHAFEPGAAENPYLALLGLGDRFVVTGDSVSMLTEIARLGRPLQIYPLPEAPSIGRRLLLRAERSAALAGGLGLLRRWGLAGWPRDLTALHDLLVRQGRAVRLGEDVARVPASASASASASVPPEDELTRVVGRVREVLNGEG